MDNIDQLLNDFYSKYTGSPLTPEKLSTIKSTYGNNYDVLLKDLYSKYNQPLDDVKLKTIKDTYKLSAPTFDFDTNKNIPGADKDLGWRNNNPLNLKDTKGKFRTFNTLEEGYQAAERDLRFKVSGKSPVFNNNLRKAGKTYEQATVKDLILTWAPKKDNSEAALKGYFKRVSDMLGADVETTHPSKVNMQDLVIAMSSFESPLSYNAMLKSREGGFQQQQPEDSGQVPTQQPLEVKQKVLTELELKIKNKVEKGRQRSAYQTFGSAPQALTDPNVDPLVVRRKVYDDAFKSGLLNVADFTNEELTQIYKEDDAVKHQRKIAKESKKYLEEQLKDEGFLESVGDFIAGSKLPYLPEDMLDTKDGKINIQYKGLYSKKGDDGVDSKRYLTPDEIMNLKYHPDDTTKDPNSARNKYLRKVQNTIAASEKAEYTAESIGVDRRLGLINSRIEGIKSDLDSRFYKGILDDLQNINQKIEANTATPEEIEKVQKYLPRLQESGLLNEISGLSDMYNQEVSKLTSLEGKLGTLKKMRALENIRTSENEARKRKMSSLSRVVEGFLGIAETSIDKLTDMPKDIANLGGLLVETVTTADLNVLDNLSKKALINPDKIKTSKESRSAYDRFIKVGDAEVVFKDGKADKVFDAEGYEITDKSTKSSYLKKAQNIYNEDSSNLNWGRLRFDGMVYGVEETAPDLVNIFLTGNMIGSAGRSAIKQIAASTATGSKPAGVVNYLKNAAANVGTSSRLMETLPMIPVFSGQMMEEAIREGKVATSGELFAATMAKLGEEAFAEMLFAGPMGKMLSGKGINGSNFSSLTQGKIKDLYENIISGKIKPKDYVRELYKTGKELAKDTATEGIEEAVIEIIDPSVNEFLNYTLETSYDEKPINWEDVISSFGVGAAAGGVMGLVRSGKSVLDIKRSAKEHYKDLINSATNNNLSSQISNNTVKNPEAFKAHSQTLLDRKDITQDQFNQVVGAVEAAAKRSERLNEPKKRSGLSRLLKDDTDLNEGFNRVYRNLAFDAEMNRLNTSENPEVEKKNKAKTSYFESILDELDINQANDVYSVTTPSNLEEIKGYNVAQINELRERHKKIAEAVGNSKYSNDTKAKIFELQLKREAKDVSLNKENITEQAREKILREIQELQSKENDVKESEEKVKNQEEENQRVESKKQEILSGAADVADPESGQIINELLSSLEARLLEEDIPETDTESIEILKDEYREVPGAIDLIDAHFTNKNLVKSKNQEEQYSNTDIDWGKVTLGYTESVTEKYKNKDGSVNEEQLSQDQKAINELYRQAFPVNTLEEQQQQDEYLNSATFEQKLVNDNAYRDLAKEYFEGRKSVGIDPIDSGTANVSTAEQLSAIRDSIRQKFDEIVSEKEPVTVSDGRVLSGVDLARFFALQEIENLNIDLSEKNLLIDFINEYSEVKSDTLEDNKVNPENSKNNLQLRNIGFITTESGTRYYNIQYYNANNEPIGEPVQVEASIIESKDFYNKDLMLSKKGDVNAVSYKIVPSKNITEDQRNENELALSLNIGDRLYYEVDMDNAWNSPNSTIRINPLTQDNFSISIVVYQKDGKAVDKGTEGATRRIVGILPSASVPQHAIENVRALREILWNDRNATVVTTVDNVTSHANYHMGNKRQVTIEDLTLSSLSEEGNGLFIVAVPWAEGIQVDSSNNVRNAILIDPSGMTPPQRSIPASWMGRVVIKIKDKFYKLDTKKIKDIPQVREKLRKGLEAIYEGITPEDSKAQWYKLLGLDGSSPGILRYRTIETKKNKDGLVVPLSTIDYANNDGLANPRGGLAPILLYYPATNTFQYDGVSYKIDDQNKEEVFEKILDQIGERSVHINHNLLNEKRYLNTITEYLETELAPLEGESTDYRTAPTVYVNKNFQVLQTGNTVPSTTITVTPVTSVSNIEAKIAEIERRRQENDKKYQETTERHERELAELNKKEGKSYINTFDILNINEYSQDKSPRSNNAVELAKRQEAEFNQLLNERRAIQQDASSISFGGMDFSNKKSVLDKLKKAIASVYQTNRQALDEGFTNWYGVIQDVINSGGDNYVAHGMGKTSIASAFNDLITLFEKGINPLKGRGALDVAPLAGGISTGNTASGNAYMDGAFTLVANRNHQGEITDISQVGGIIVNDGIATNEVMSALRELFPNLIIESTSNSKSLVEQLNTKYDAELSALGQVAQATQTSQIVEAKEQEVASLQTTQEIEKLVSEIQSTPKTIGRNGIINPKYTELLKRYKELTGTSYTPPKFKISEEVVKQNPNNQAIALQWLRERFAEIDDISIDDEAIQKLYEIFNTGGAPILGAFYKASVILSSYATEKTARHEAFHVVFNLFLNDKQREQVLDEAFQRFGKELGITKQEYELAKKQGKAVDALFSLSDQQSVNFVLKSIDILQSKEADDLFKKGLKNKWSLDKILTELRVPKEQKQLILDVQNNMSYYEEIPFNQQLAFELANNYGYTIDINVAKTKDIYQFDQRYNENIRVFEYQGFEYRLDDYYAEESGIVYEKAPLNDLNNSIRITKQEFNRAADNAGFNEREDIPTQYYSNLTVPGGTNYTENEISTPGITPSIKGHAQFATDKGIGWFRSDDRSKTENISTEEYYDEDYNRISKEEYIKKYGDKVANNIPTKTRRILEVQSDLFQKGRDRQDLTGTYSENVEGVGEMVGLEEKPSQPKANQFLQLLNKDNNWVTFFVKSIIQDSAKKGYEKVLFPTGNTASKVEGHTTLEEFKKQKEDRISKLNKEVSDLKKLNLVENYKKVEKRIDVEKYSLFNGYEKKLQGYEFRDNKGFTPAAKYGEINKIFQTKEDAQNTLDYITDSIIDEINQLKKELERVEKEGFSALRPIYNFYENTIANILKKQGYSPKLITDEYGNSWYEVAINPTRDISSIRLKTEQAVYYKAQSPLIRLEEKLADLFEDYKDERSLFSEKNKIKYPNITKFFDKIYKFLFNQYNVLQSYLTDRVTIDGLFYQLENNILGRDFLGRRKKSALEIFNRNIGNVVTNPLFKISNWNSAEVNRYADFINKDLFTSHLYSYGNNEQYKTVGLTEPTLADLLDRGLTVAQIISDFRLNFDSIAESWKEIYPESNTDLISDIQNQFRNNSDFQRIQLAKFNNLYGFNIFLKEDSSDQEADGDLHEEDIVQADGWMIENFKTSPKERLSKKLREFLSNLAIRTNGEMSKREDTFQTDYHDFEKIHNKLLSTLSDSTSISDMLNKLNTLRDKYYWVDDIYYKIYGENLYNQRLENGTLDFTIDDFKNISTLENGTVLNALWSKIGDLRNVNFVTLLYDGVNYRQINTNTKNIISSTEIKAVNFFTNNFYKDNSYTFNVDLFDQLINNILNGDAASLLEVLNVLGFSIDESVVSSIMEDPIEFPKTLEALSVVRDNILSGQFINTPNRNLLYSYKNESGKTSSADGNPMTVLSSIVVNNDLTAEQRTILTVKGEKKYNHVLNNYLTRQVNKIKQDVKAWVKSKTIVNGKKVLFHNSLEWYNDLIQNINDFDLKYLDGVSEEGKSVYSGKEYSDMNLPDISALNFNTFISSPGVLKEFKAYFSFTVFSDAGSKAFIQQRIYDTKLDSERDIIHSKFASLALSELLRIDYLKKNPTRFEYLNKNGKQFSILTFLNGHPGINLNNIESLLVNNNGKLVLSKEASKLIEKAVDNHLANEFQLYLFKLQDNGLITYKDGAVTLTPNSILDKKANIDNLRTYFYNQYYYNGVFQSAFSNDPSFYKTTVIEVQKRNKQNDSPTENGNFSKPSFSALLLKDQEIPSDENVVAAIKALGYDPKTEESLLKKYESNNTSDAGTYHSLSRRKDIMQAYDEWNESLHGPMFERLENGTATPEDLQFIIQPIKPFYFGNAIVSDEISQVAIVAPIQLKNSEHLLVPQLAFLLKDGSLSIPESTLESEEITDFSKYKYPDLAKTLYLMNRHKVDVVLFESAVKASNFNLLDFTETNDQTVSLNRVELPNEFWGKQVSLPQKHQDVKNLLSSQLRKIMTGDIDPNFSFNYSTKDIEALLDQVKWEKSTLSREEITRLLSNTSFSQNDFKDLFELTIALDISEELEFTNAELSDPKSFYNKLRDRALRDTPSYHVAEAMEIQEDGKILQPLEIQGAANEALANAEYKKVSKIKSPGVSLVNAPGFGVSDEVKIVFKKDDQGNITGEIDYFEALVPLHSKHLEIFADENGIIDPKDPRIPEGALDFILYRIPTEGKYSIFPIKVVGFTPNAMGGVVLLPREVTTIAGLDFDADKLYGFVKKMKYIYGKDYLQILTNTSNTTLGTNLSAEEVGKMFDDYVNLEQEEFQKLYNVDEQILMGIQSDSRKRFLDRGNKEGEIITGAKIIESGLATTDQRANLRLDLMLAVSKSKEYAKDLFKGGSKQILEDKVKSLKETESNLGNNLDFEFNIANPNVQEDISARNLVGKRLIGIFANANAFYNLIQGKANLSLSTPVSLWGKKYDDLSLKQEINGLRKISENLATFLFASTEDTKSPVLAPLNINELTANILITLTYLGVPMNDILRYMQLPIIKNLVKYAQNNNISDLKTALYSYVKTDEFKNSKLTDYDVIQLSNLITASEKIRSVQGALKVDTGNVGPSLADVEYLVIRLMNLYNSTVNSIKPTIIGLESIIPGIVLNQGKYSLESKSNIIQLNAYTNVLIQELNTLSKYYNYLNPKFLIIKERISEIATRELRVKDYHKINMEIYNAMIQNAMHSVVKQGENIFDIYDLYENFPSEFLESKLLNRPKYKELKAIFDITTASNGLNVLTADTTGMSKVQSDKLKDLFSELLAENQKANNYVGVKLALYATILGYSYSKYSFSHLIPPAFYSTFYGKKIRNIVNGTTPSKLDTVSILDLVIKNNFTRLFEKSDINNFEVLKDGTLVVKQNLNQNIIDELLSKRYIYLLKDTIPMLYEMNPTTGELFPIDTGLSSGPIKDYIQNLERAIPLREALYNEKVEKAKQSIVPDFFTRVSNYPESNIIDTNTLQQGTETVISELKNNQVDNILSTPTPEVTQPPVTSSVSQSNKPKGQEVKEGIYVNQEALTQEEQLEIFNYLKPYLEEQAAKTNKGANASKMIGLGLRWDYKSNNPGKQSINISDVINPGNKDKYGYYNTSINGQTLGQITPRIKELIEKATGVDITHYDGAIINLYDNESFISTHNDVDESKSAIKYPVIGINLGGTGNFSIESRDGNPKQLDLKPGTAYIFGVDGINREVFHRTFPGKQNSFLPKLTTKLDGKTYEAGSYRVTITMRRVMPLTQNIPQSPQATTTDRTVEYTPIGKEKQTYTIVGKQIFNKNGVEVFKEDSVDRNKIFANLAVKEGRAVVVTYRENQYIVNNKDVIISGTTGKVMQWGSENGDRKAIVKLAKDKFASKDITTEDITLTTPIEIKPQMVDLINTKTTIEELKELYNEIVKNNGKEVADKYVPFFSSKKKEIQDAANPVLNYDQMTDDQVISLANSYGKEFQDYLHQSFMLGESDAEAARNFLKCK